MTRQIDDLLDVFRLTRRRIDQQLETIDLSRIFSQSVETRAAIAREAAPLERMPIFRSAVALLDFGLPEIDGYDLADRIHADSHLSTIWVIAMTG